MGQDTARSPSGYRCQHNSVCTKMSDSPNVEVLVLTFRILIEKKRDNENMTRLWIKGV